MLNKKIVILDGRRSGDETLDSTFAILTQVLEQGGAEVQVFSLRAMKLAHCIGCFGCWFETPGLCRYNEAGRGILQSVIQSDTIVLFTPVVFGGYSSQLKQLVDRFASLCLPYFRSYHGEIHHVPRYARNPRWVAIGVQEQSDAAEAQLFKLLVGRNAINFHAPSYAAAVVTSADDPIQMRKLFRSLPTRQDPFPWGDSVKSHLPMPDGIVSHNGRENSHRALLIVGSAKTLTPSTSSVLGNHLLARLKERGWMTESLTLKPSLLKEQGQASLLAAVDRADLLLFAFPLYIDSLPFLMIKALEVISAHRQASDPRRPPRLFAISNNGFAESYQNNLALSICRCFAAATDMTWLGGMGLGAGEVVSGGEPLKPVSAVGVPCGHVIQALDAAATALGQGQAVPVEAVQRIAQNPIPHAPFALWRWLFVRGAAQMWQKRAAEHGVSRQAMLARPGRNP